MLYYFNRHQFVGFLILASVDIGKIATPYTFKFKIFVENRIFLEICQLLQPLVPHSHTLHQKLALRVYSVAVSQLYAAFLGTIDGVDSESFEVDDIFGNFADFVREDEDSGPYKTKVHLFSIKSIHFAGCTLNLHFHSLKLRPLCSHLPDVCVET